jgi:hypothetical protein
VNLYSYTLWQVPCNECPINLGDGTRLAYRDPRMSHCFGAVIRAQSMAEARNILKLDLAAIDVGEVALALGEPPAHDKDLPVWARS